MSKDPAFLFYTSDFLTGTMFMTNEQVGIYIRLLCAQHQHNGRINETAFNSIVGEHKIIVEKFERDEKGYFNPRLNHEMDLRAEKSLIMSKNASKRWHPPPAMQKHSKSIALAMPIEDENEDDNVIDNKKAFKAWEGTLIKAWDDFCNKFPQLARIKHISESRRKKIKARYLEPHFKDLDKIFTAIAEQKQFLILRAEPNAWRISFDWLIQNDINYLKVLERKYLNEPEANDVPESLRKYITKPNPR